MKELIGQIIMAGLPGPKLDDNTKKLIELFRVNNFILFKRNLDQGPDIAAKLIEDIKVYCKNAGLSLPLIAIDQEGGPVQRLSPPFWPSLISNQEVGNDLEPFQKVIYQAKMAAKALKKLGININLAPVLDLATPEQNDVLSQRCYSSDPLITGELGSLYVETLQNYCIAATAKHFPGIGRTKQDPHIKQPTIYSEPDKILTEAYPFQLAIDARVQGIMTSHILFPSLDPDHTATFSYTITTQLLRNNFGFNGVVFTDDLEMGGITENINVPEAALKALKAGHDMLLICHNQGLIIEAIDAIGVSVSQEDYLMDRLDQARARIDQLRIFIEECENNHTSC